MVGCPKTFPNGKVHGMDFIDKEGFCKAPSEDPKNPDIKYCWYRAGKKVSRGRKKYTGLCIGCGEEPVFHGRYGKNCHAIRQTKYQLARRSRLQPKPLPVELSGDSLREIIKMNIFNMKGLFEKAGLGYHSVYTMLISKKNLHQNNLNLIGREIKKQYNEVLTILERK